jgi:hypothetical protein
MGAMSKNVDIDRAYVLSEDVILREIEGEAIIVPIGAGIGDMEDELYTVNDSGKAIIALLDGKKSLSDVIQALMPDFAVDEKDLRADVTGFVSELYRRKILVEAP